MTKSAGYRALAGQAAQIEQRPADAAALSLDYSVSKPLEKPTLRVLSFGAGVQSTVLLFRSLNGDFGPRPDAVIFSDTQFEPPAVYENWRWVQGEVARRTNGQVQCHEVTAGDIRADHEQGVNSTGQRFASMPLYTEGGKGMGRRQCTREYKIEPVEKKVRGLLGLKKGQRTPKGVTVEMWIGLSTDELPRLKYNKKKWISNRWPLIELRMNRGDCRAWFRREFPAQPLVKSACIACPFRDNASWRWMKENAPRDFEKAVSFDDAIRENGSKLRGMNEQQFVHKSGVPLRDADLDIRADGDLFLGECDGVCGT